MQDHFGWLIEDTLKQTQSVFFWEKDKREKQFCSKKINTGPKEIEVTSDGWTAAEGKATLRYARFQSGIIDIATIMIYPTASPELLPVFAAEWVAVMGNIHVVVLDVMDLKENRPLASILPLKKKWERTFPNNKERPEWFNEIASPQHIFSKCSLSSLHELRTMFNEYLLTTVDQIYTKNLSVSKGGIDHACVRSYKMHHEINSPARTIVKDNNKAWLDEYLKNYHFGIV